MKHLMYSKSKNIYSATEITAKELLICKYSDSLKALRHIDTDDYLKILI